MKIDRRPLALLLVAAWALGVAVGAELLFGTGAAPSAHLASALPAGVPPGPAAADPTAAGDAGQAGSLDALEAQSFALNLVLYAASTTATGAERLQIHPLLLGYEPSAAVDARLPWRREVAARVGAWPAAARRQMLAFLLAHRVAVTHINALALQMVGPAPAFAPVPGEVDTHALTPPLAGLWRARPQLAALMREAWGPLGGARLWRDIGPRWRAERIPAGQVGALRGRVAAFLGLPTPPPQAGSEVVHNPLMPADAAVTSVFADGHTWVVVGPTASPRQDDALLAHELAHPLVQAAIDGSRRLQRAIDRSTCAYAAVQARGESRMLTQMVYTSWESYFTESLIRGTIDDLYPAATAHEQPLVLEPALGAALADAHRHGHKGDHAIEDLLAGPCARLCSPAAGG